MRISATQYNLHNKALEIYISGCDGSCGDICHNQEIWDFSIGEDYQKELPKILKKIKDFDSMIDNIWILGGEPLLQDEEDLMEFLLKLTHKTVWLFTRFDICEVSESILSICNYIKCGRYMPDLVCDDNIQYGVKLSTSNQKIYKLL